MPKMISPDQLHDIFNIFHDGVIESAQIIDGDCFLHIGIAYLANRINPEFEGFEVQLKNSTIFHFEGWFREVSKGTCKICDFKAIFGNEIEILSAEAQEGRISIACNIHDFESDFCGGTLSFKSDVAFVLDPMNRSYSLDELDQLCKEYWNDWSGKNKKA